MATLVLMDEDFSPRGIKRRLNEEFARRSIESDSEAASMFGRPQQWLSRRMTGETEWKVAELVGFCRALGVSYVYVTTGIREIPSGPGGVSSDANATRSSYCSSPVRRLRAA